MPYPWQDDGDHDVGRDNWPRIPDLPCVHRQPDRYATGRGFRRVRLERRRIMADGTQAPGQVPAIKARNAGR